MLLCTHDFPHAGPEVSSSIVQTHYSPEVFTNASEVTLFIKFGFPVTLGEDNFTLSCDSGTGSLGNFTVVSKAAGSFSVVVFVLSDGHFVFAMDNVELFSFNRGVLISLCLNGVHIFVCSQIRSHLLRR